MNDKQKQIEEMAKIIIKAGESYYKMPVDIECANREAVALYEEGYRKQSDTARDIIEMLKAAKGVVKVHFEAYDELINNIVAQYGVEVE